VTSTATTRHGLAHEHGSGWLGIQEGDHGPFRRFPKNCRFAGQKPAGVRVRALWGQPRARLALQTRGSTATTGAWHSPPTTAADRSRTGDAQTGVHLSTAPLDTR
jgi:hypothetical protein